MIPPGNLTVCYGKIHHAINGKAHYFDPAMASIAMLNHQRVDFDPSQCRWNFLNQLFHLRQPNPTKQ